MSDTFPNLLRSEWTKFRTVRGWVIATIVGAAVIVLLGVLTGAGSRSSYQKEPGGPEIIGTPYVAIGPGGEAVTDRFFFVHQPFDGDGSITARVASLTARTYSLNGVPPSPDDVPPWAKAGLILKVNTEQGSAYAAIMVTGGHGVRMQYNFTGDISGPPTVGTPAWLRLSRSGDTITGSASSDGSTWTTVGTVRLNGFPSTVQGGLFSTTPTVLRTTQHIGGGGSSTAGGFTLATATFDSVAHQGRWPDDRWTGEQILTPDESTRDGEGFVQSGSTFTVTGSGDIAPEAGLTGSAVERLLVGGFGALIVLVVLAVLFVTTEYRRGLIRTSLSASPRRVRVLAAKAIVIGGVTFVAGLIGAAITVPISTKLMHSNGNFVYPISALTQLRLIAGTAAVLAVSAVFALAVGSILRRSAGAVAAVVLLVVLPYILAAAAVLPPGPSQWLLRVTPAAGFAIQQSIPQFSQVDGVYTPAFGFYPLGPWAGFAVLCGYAVVAFTLAAYLLRRRDV